MSCSIINSDQILSKQQEKPSVVPYESGMSRRDFLKQSASTAMLAGLLGSKPVFAKSDSDSESSVFNDHQRLTMSAVQQVLFPEDGDGPSAKDLKALRYLEWAMQDPKNIEDGDPGFLIKGINGIDVVTRQDFNKKFIELTDEEKVATITKIEKSRFGDNWLSLIIYYLVEALLLDPAYGGNPGGIGWKWLSHQPGFPRPNQSQTFENYLQ